MTGDFITDGFGRDPAASVPLASSYKYLNLRRRLGHLIFNL
ncbi:hypothetical protein PAMC26577_04880 [Caballeronia sordidicola]|uniref:Uncharacterized protein n=1 Tax=Caballeronia sordidicola TaxID=196367 RepID=A0A242N4D0_CABSO|nr:hypothetical protein PAMC26577_04880 [Caballeronia sordidicola]